MTSILKSALWLGKNGIINCLSSSNTFFKLKVAEYVCPNSRLSKFDPSSYGKKKGSNLLNHKRRQRNKTAFKNILMNQVYLILNLEVN